MFSCLTNYRKLWKVVVLVGIDWCYVQVRGNELMVLGVVLNRDNQVRNKDLPHFGMLYSLQ